MEKGRRTFIKNTAVLSGGLCIGILNLLPGCASISYVTATEEENRLVIKKSDWGEGDFVVIKTRQLPKPIYVSRLAEDKYAAVLMRCTHKQCEVRPYSQGLSCPCHGSEFDRTGKVLEGPAPSDLMKFTVTTDVENIYIS